MSINETVVARRLRFAVLTAVFVLILALVAWRVMTGFSTVDAVLVTLLTLPLWIALPRLRAGHRRSYAWMTLAITPFLVLALTESVAKPADRGWAALCLVCAFGLFVLLVSYLRATRPGA
jgi:uncharacterized membrane protein